MRFPFRAITALTLAAAPATLYGQGPTVAGNPAARLLEHRAELSLTAEQVKRLEELNRRTTQQDAELRSRLEALRGKPAGEPLLMWNMTPEQREQLAANRAAMQPLAQELRSIHARAAADASAVLTPEQRTKADSFLFRGPGRGRGRGPAGGRPAGAGWRAGRDAGVGPGWRAGAGEGAGPGGRRMLRQHRHGWW
jgi:Spy/CpxP family protein refolding chaperone